MSNRSYLAVIVLGILALVLSMAAFTVRETDLAIKFRFGEPTSPKGTTVRTVMKAQWTQVEKDAWHFEVQADAFLYRMVRRLVFVQVSFAQGKFPVEALARSLADHVPAGKRSELPAGLAPAHGLTLAEVAYPASVESIGH